MKISAVGARRSVYEHEVADEEIENVAITSKGNIRVKIQSEQDPGIGTGLFDLTMTFSKQEVVKMYEKAIVSDQEVKLRATEKRIRLLERKLK